MELFIRLIAGDTLSFSIVYSDQDSIYITHKGNIFGPPGSSPYATLPNTSGMLYVSSQFNWATSCAQASVYPYLFSVYARDNGCPYKTKINDFEIYVKPPIPPDSISGKKLFVRLMKTSDTRFGVLIRFLTVTWSGDKWYHSRCARILIKSWSTGLNTGREK